MNEKNMIKEIDSLGILNISPAGDLTPGLAEDAINAVREIKQTLDISGMAKRAHAAKKRYKERI